MVDRLEITAETCVSKVRVMRGVSVSEEDNACRVCNTDYQSQCPDYKPIGRTQTPFRRGVNALIGFYERYISISSLPTEVE